MPENIRKMLIAYYLRVSTMRQKEEGTSLDTQAAKCRRLKEADGYQGVPVDELREQASGADPDRPEFLKLRRMVADGVVAAVYANSPDRLTRDPVELIEFARLCEESGVKLRFVEGPSGTSNQDRLMQYLYGFVGQEERRLIVERTTRGKRAIAQSGRMPVGTGGGLFGYDYDKNTKRRTINEKEASIVRLMFYLSAFGLGILQICRKLNQAGITTRGGYWWSLRQAWKILTHTAYIGLDYYGRSRCRTVRGGKVIQTPQAPEEWTTIRGYSPPIMEEALFYEVQRRMPEHLPRRPISQRNYLLTGFIKCRTCGSGWVGDSRKNKLTIYRCMGRRSSKGKAAICDEPKLSADELESLVLGQLTAAITHPNVIDRALRPHLEPGGLNLRREMSRLRREIRECKKEERRWLEFYGSGNFEEEKLNGLVAPVRVLMGEQERDLLLLQEQDSFDQDPAEKSRQLAAHSKRIADDLSHREYDAQRATLEAFEVKILIGKGEVDITLFVDPA